MKLLREGRSFSGHERNCVFLNCQQPRFADVSAITGLDFPDDGRAVAVTDWDQDGDLDIWLYNRSGPRLRWMRNETVSGEDSSAARFVAIRPQGTTSNRDAIGARVAVVTDGTAKSCSPDGSNIRPLIQTVYAGDAYLSQSSKWLHFGLGTEGNIQEVIVRWPNGRSEHFSGCQAGRRYRLVEGTGAALDVTGPPRTSALIPSRQPAVEPDPSYRTFFGNRLPVPILRYEPWDGTETRVIESAGRPMLVALWASWCEPCVEELKAFSHLASELPAGGLDILAISLDGLDSTRSTGPPDAHRLLDEIGFQFPAGVATSEMLDKITIAAGILLNRQPPLSVPTSLLIDADGALAAIYYGPIDVRRLVDDVAQLNVPIHNHRDLAVPMAGRWNSRPRNLLLRAVARHFQEFGHQEDYARYLRLETEVLARQREQASSAEQRRQLDRHYAADCFSLGLAFASAGQPREALDQFQRTIEAQPDHVEAMINLGVLWARLNQAVAAIDVLSRAVAIEPDSIPARMNLAAALGAQGDFTRAIEHYRHVIRLQPRTTDAEARLARALLEVGDPAQAADHFQRALEVDPGDARSLLCLAWLRATSGLESIRDGSRAVELAEQLHAAKKETDALALDVLAAAWAERGDFARANAYVIKALDQLGPKPSALRTAILERKKGYEAKQPARDEDGKYP
jgi:tetratricopeptide (TPR) repeat protein